MPPHPVEACYCHVIEAGVQNIQRLAAVGDMAGVAVEADHVAYVARLLDDYLLYRGTRNFDEARHRAYWCEARITYQSQASSESLAAMETPWLLLAPGLGNENGHSSTIG